MNEEPTSEQPEGSGEAQQKPEAQREPTALPPPPERFLIPTQLLEQWISIPPQQLINAPLTKQDIDHLFFGLLRNNEAQLVMDRTIVAWSNGKTDEANTHLVEYRRLLAESDNHIRQFMMGLMVSATIGKSNAP